ncbi:trafficking protein particle complex subunit 13-like isoform X1 [Chenopodium quinoa]|uniref:trafficking protein particle complex subunit 13-like isoform X1 n=1 Tax=Chenopodium quinoa TaxID=63459 RepID=UPI000B774F2A|nr:trafficking protein particle complex subunit 13-like isoform X1 [Chenopodium quinoa]
MSGASGGAQANHSLAFRVMRLCRPSLHVETPLLFDPADLLVGEGDSSSLLPHSLSSDNSDNGSDNDLSFRSRFLLSDPSSASGLSGLLVLPQSFGAIYLGETFCSYISINNSSNFEVREIVIKAEIQTERQRILLLDTSKSPVETIRAGGRYDFIVEHDVKELGAHTLVCSAMYNDSDGVRKYLPQFFKFIVANPLSVRTKVRMVKDLTFLEACIENHTKSNLYMDQVEFQPAQHWGATVLTADTNLAEKDSTSDKEIFKPPVLIKSGGGIHNFLYQLKLSAQESTQTRIEGSNILGKLQITWRTNLGEPGRLQTQHILGSPVPRKEIDLQVVKIPPAIILHKPFEVQLSLTNQTERALGPFEIWFSGDANGERAFMVNGLQTLTLTEIRALSSTDLKVNLIATKLGVQKITGITVFDSIEKKTYEPLPDLEIFVDLD